MPGDEPETPGPLLEHVVEKIADGVTWFLELVNFLDHFKLNSYSALFM